MKFGTQNVRRLYTPGALRCLLTEMEQYKVDIIPIQEVRYPRCGDFAPMREDM